MPHDLSLSSLHNYVQETKNFLISKLSRDQNVSPAVAGWHNFFVPGRIGPTGTAVPLLFLNKLKADFPHRDEVINKLLTSQFFQEGAWSVLSQGELVTVEGTAWPLRALAIAGDVRAREAVFKGERWLLTQQNMQGGWGSTIDNSPRTLLTAISMESLACLTSPPREAISKAVSWLSQIQRPDGSWGEESGRDGTLFHTAIVTKTLLEIGLLSSDPRLISALSFLKSRWSPNSNNFYQEIYDVHFSDGYFRVSIEHDVDAAIVEALLKARRPGGIEMILEAVEGMIDLHQREGKLSPPNMRPSIWNILPRAQTLLDVLNSFPVGEEGRVLNFKEAILYSPSLTQLNKKGLTIILLKRVIIPRFRWTSLALLFVILVTFLIVYYYIRGLITFPDVVLSLFVELTGLFLGLLIDSRRAKNG